MPALSFGLVYFVSRFLVSMLLVSGWSLWLFSGPLSFPLFVVGLVPFWGGLLCHSCKTFRDTNIFCLLIKKKLKLGVI